MDVVSLLLLLLLSASMFGVGISLPKQLVSLKPISSASMIMMLGFARLLPLLLVVLMIVLEEENCYGGRGIGQYYLV